ncbi:MAG: hypothetical protein FJ207_12470 [Gemmatimonadetes bacterium]|nr:hypothetical protein [Gemmatimonadota bacterium]
MITTSITIPHRPLSAITHSRAWFRNGREDAGRHDTRPDRRGGTAKSRWRVTPPAAPGPSESRATTAADRPPDGAPPDAAAPAPGTLPRPGA